MADATGASYTFHAPRSIHFGVGVRRRVGDACRQLHGSHALVVCDQAMDDLGHLRQLRADLASSGIDSSVYLQPIAEPSVQDCDDAVRMVRALPSSDRINCILAVGGGSTIDVAKALRAMLPSGLSMSALVDGRALPEMLPLVVLPTTSGSGSELTAGAVFKSGKGKPKVALASNRLRPDGVLVDPELTLSCPRRLTAEAGVDALTHALESFCALESSSVAYVEEAYASGRTALTTLLAQKAVSLLATNLERCVADGSDLSARIALAEGSMLAALAYGNSGLHCIHAMSYAFGSRRTVSHSQSLAVFVAPAVNFLEESGLCAFDELVDYFPPAAQTFPSELASRVRALLCRLGFEVSLRAFGLDQGEIEAIAHEALQNERLSDKFPGDAMTAFPAIVQGAVEGRIIGRVHASSLLARD